MTKNELYTICGLLEQAKTKTAKLIADYQMKLSDYPELAKELEDPIKLQLALYKHYDKCIQSVKEELK